MMKNLPSPTPETYRADEEGEDWNALSARIQKLAHRRSRSLLADHDDDAFDRGARSLRTLMSAAEVAGRMRREEAKERETHEQAAGRHDFTEIESTFQNARLAQFFGAAKRTAGFSDDKARISFLVSKVSGDVFIEDQYMPEPLTYGPERPFQQIYKLNGAFPDVQCKSEFEWKTIITTEDIR